MRRNTQTKRNTEALGCIKALFLPYLSSKEGSKVWNERRRKIQSHIGDLESPNTEVGFTRVAALPIILVAAHGFSSLVTSVE